MKFLRIGLLIALFVGFVGVMQSNAQCNPDPFKPDLRAPCESIMDRLSKAADAAKDFQKNVDQLNKEIGDARDKYWKRYPDKQGYEQAEADFYAELMQKDLYYLMLSLPVGMNDRALQSANIMGMLTGSVSPDELGKFPKNVDGGIRAYAFPLFANWVNALRRAEGRQETKGDEGTFATPFILAKAIQDRSNWRKAYEDSRNWAEFLSSGIDITRYVTPKAYLLHQMEADVSLVNAKAKPADLPEPVKATKELYDQFVKMFGEKEVLAAATKVLSAPKNSMGGLAPRAEVSVGSYTHAPSPAPMLLFFTTVTNATPKNYAIALCMDQFNYPGIDVMVNFETRETWGKAYTCYEQLVTKYGEASVLSAAGKLRVAEKNSSGGLRADPQSGSMTLWFQKLLKDPKAAIPDMQVAKFHAGSYDEHWMGRMVEVRGTVTRVDLAKGQFPPWATIHFKEAKNDNLTVFSPNSDMWQEKFNDDFSGLTGKSISVWGQIESWKNGAGVRVITSDQLKVVDSSALNFTDSRPEWLTAPLPVKTLVDFPKYLAWKKFPVGTTVTYETRLLNEYKPGTNLYSRTKISVNTFRLEAIDEKRAIVVVNGMVWHFGNNPQPTEERKLIFQAKVSPEDFPQEKPTETGDESIEISGKKYATHWNSIWGKHIGTDPELDPQTFTKTWTNEEVPSGVVLEQRQEHRDNVGGAIRFITETILVPTAGVEPELGNWSAYQLQQNKSGSSVKQIPPQVNNLPSAGATNTPQNPSAAPGPTRAPGAGKGSASANVNPGPMQTGPNGRPRAEAPITQTPPQQAPTLPPNASPQMVFAQHYSQVMVRSARVRAGLAQWQRSHGGPNAQLPEVISAAKARMEDQFQAVTNSMRAQDTATADKQLTDVEATLTVIEQFLGNGASK